LDIWAWFKSGLQALDKISLSIQSKANQIYC
jgi:hypothetical protein